MRLSPDTVARLDTGVARFAYDRDGQQAGIVHLGIGAFHRAHQAVYTDDAMNAGDRDWAIVGVSLRSPGVATQMNPQGGLYTVAQRSAAGSAIRLIGSVRQVLVATGDREAVVAQLASPATHIVSFTVTEKGYCRAPDGSLDPVLADAGSFYPLLTEAMARRRAAGLSGLTLLSCDNLAGNGAQLERLMREHLGRSAPDLLAWFDGECACPSTMVDRIVPATTDADRAAIAAATGLEDEAAVVTEPFSQWVIEDRFAGPRPRWEVGGAQFTSDVHPFEVAKLRMLNGAHSALAYLGLAHGHRFVHEAIGDPGLRPLIDRLMRQEAATSLQPAPGQDLGAYADALIARFANPALNHRLDQIAMDGSQKIPQRWLATLAWHQARGARCDAILSALGAWLAHARGDNGVVDDPRADALGAAWADGGGAGIVDAVLGSQGLLASDWRPDADDRAMIESRLA